ncbi:MAG: 30S ribosomal protein S12 methylthiotransferase RimO [Chloroflexota bacterium]|nr:30S ribosomal protein S12 methylthiotransferase RimO [Chloroflexota bacterium]
MRFHIITLGCPRNVVDSEMMAQLLHQEGHTLVEEPEQADLLILNTCAFIEAARRETYEMLEELAADKKPSQKLIVAGCLPQRYKGDVVDRFPAVDAIIGTRSWPEITSVVRALQRERRGIDYVKQKGNLVASVRRCATMGGTAYLKIADGCNACCAFCAIPLIKGPQRSKPEDYVLREAHELVEEGVREIILIAQDTTTYGWDRTDVGNLPTLLRSISEQVPQLDWLRILYAYPQHVTEELMYTMAELDQVCHYLDIPLQHGHPDVLRRMRRSPDMDGVYNLVASLREAMPDIALRSTFIVGYPGETEDEFETLLQVMRDLAFDHVGIFAFSPEEGTPAAELPNRVPRQVMAERYERAMLLQQEISVARNQEQVGRSLPILIDGAGDGISIGRSYRHAPEIDGLVLLSGEFPTGDFVEAKIVQAREYDLTGEPLI